MSGYSGIRSKQRARLDAPAIFARSAAHAVFLFHVCGNSLMAKLKEAASRQPSFFASVASREFCRLTKK